MPVSVPLLETLRSVLSYCFLLSFLGILLASVWHLYRGCWKAILFSGSMILLGAVLLCFETFSFSLPVSLSPPINDHFADALTIPDGIEIAKPLPAPELRLGEAADTLQTAVFAAIETPGDVAVTADISALVRLHNENPKILRRYLATSPVWRLCGEWDSVFATRRWMIGSAWSLTPDGEYRNAHFGQDFTPDGRVAGNGDNQPKQSPLDYALARGKADRAAFETRCTIGLSGKPWAPLNPGTLSHINPGETVPDAAKEPGSVAPYGWCMISADGLVVGIFEQSWGTERRVTKATFAQLKREFDPLAESPTWETIQACLPPDSIRRGSPSLELRSYFQSGSYTAEIWLNPGESGMIYLKAFEATNGTRLSEDSLKRSSNEWIGWSDDPAELFFSNTNFTIYEGDRGKPYAARFEVWFVPDSGGKERKLMEKVFKIEGWQR
jgi:hypothetical protein